MRERRPCAYEKCDESLPVDAPENQRFHHPRCKSAHWRLKRERPKRVKPSGRQVSYRKAVEVMARALAFYTECRPEKAQQAAEWWMHTALPERQR